MNTRYRALFALFLLAACTIADAQTPPRRRVRRWYVRPINQNRDQDSAYQRLIVLLRTIDPEKHRNFFRIDRQRFDHLLELIRPIISHARTHRLPMSPETRLAMTLRFLASGDNFPSLGYHFHCSPTQARAIVYEVCDALKRVLTPVHLPKPTQEMWQKSADGFLSKWNFPNHVAAVDGKHCQITCPRHGGSKWFNHKNHHSIVLMAAVASDYRFLWVNIGECGRKADSTILSMSKFGRDLDAGRLKFPHAAPLPGTQTIAPYVCTGDEGFMLKRNFLRPFPRARLQPDSYREHVFNYRLSRARRISENAFGILANRWRVLRKPLGIAPSNAALIVWACVLMHNYMLDTDTNATTSYTTPLQGDTACELPSVGRTSSNNYSREAVAVRNLFADWFCSPAGAVPWQNKVVNRGRIQKRLPLKPVN